jgi:hypothetical protein
MCRLWLLGLLISAALAPPAGRTQGERRPANSLSPQQVAAGWILLFDGETTLGWAPRGEVKFRFADGALVASDGGRGVLSTTAEFADYTLKAQVWIDEKANSGIFLRCPLSGEITEANAYEANVYDAHATWPTGSINRVGKTRVPVRSVGKWSDFEIRADGDRLRVSIDGKVTLEARDRNYRRGTIGLQYNGQGTVKFRNVMLQPLGLQSIFNGKDLSGWKVIPGHRSVYTVTPEGWLNVKNGNGEIQTEATYGDFLLQLEVFSNGEHLNSGVFFREQPGQFWAGYEAQIRNEWRGDDRTKPVDFGTGAIYNRQPARRVVSSDHEWFTMTIAAHGNHFATWVNGIQVTDFTDTRPESDNARQGLRLKAGVLGLQGHDPTTDLSFRNLRIAELPRAGSSK